MSLFAFIKNLLPGKSTAHAGTIAGVQPALFQPRMMQPAEKVTNLPPRDLVGNIKGREAAIRTVLQNLQQHRIASLSSSDGALQTPGMNRVLFGVGWAALDSDFTSAAFLLHADSKESLDFQLASLSRIIARSQKGAALTVQQRRDVFLHWLQRHRGWLILVRGLNDRRTAQAIESLAQELTHGLWVTEGNYPLPTEATVLEIGPLSPETSLELLKAEVPAETRPLCCPELCKELAQAAKGSTTVLENAAALLQAYALNADLLRKDLAEARDTYRKLLDSTPLAYEDMAGAVLLLNLHKLPAASQALLNLCCYLAATSVPHELWEAEPEILLQGLQAVLKARGEPAPKDPFPLLKAAQTLHERKLARWNNGKLAVHADILDFARACLGAHLANPLAEKQQWAQWAMQLVSAKAQKLDDNDAFWDELRPHAEVQISYARALGQPQKAIRLAHKLGSFLIEQQVLAKAEKLFRECLQWEEQAYGKDSPQCAYPLTKLALILRMQDKLDEAEKCLEDVLKLFPESHSQRAAALQNLALVEKQRGNLERCLELQRQALRLAQQLNDSAQPEVANRLYHLACTLKEREQLAEAEPLLGQAIRILEAAGSEHRDLLALAYTAIAEIYVTKGQLKQAEALLRTAIQAQSESKGRLCIENIAPMSILAHAFLNNGQHAHAEPVFQELIAIIQRIKGETNPQLVSELLKLAEVNMAQAKWKTAEGQLQRALSVSEDLYGQQAPALVPVLELLSKLYWVNNLHQDARPYLERIWSIWQVHPEFNDFSKELCERLRQAFSEDTPLPPGCLLETAPAIPPEDASEPSAP